MHFSFSVLVSLEKVFIVELNLFLFFSLLRNTVVLIEDFQKKPMQIEIGSVAISTITFHCNFNLKRAQGMKVADNIVYYGLIHI